MAVTWKFTGAQQMAEFLRKEADELRSRSKKVASKSEAKSLMHEAHGWAQAAMIVENSVFETETTNGQ